MTPFDRITINPRRLGEPTIRNMRITVQQILKTLADLKTFYAVLNAYPELEREDIQQALLYAAHILYTSNQFIPIKTEA